MRPFHYVVLSVVLMGGLAGSVLLIPDDSDLGLMYFRAHQYAEARPLLEKRLAAGDRSPGVIMPLAELCVEAGEVDRAVELLRAMTASNVDRLELFRKVAVFQKYNQQTEDYLHTLEAIEKIAGSEDGLRELTVQYRYANDNARLIPALQTLIARYEGTPSEYLELANLFAVGSRFADAERVMDRFEIRHPGDVSAEAVELLVSVLLDSGQEPRALDRAARWLARRPEPDSVVRFAALMRSRRKPELAAKLLEPFESSIDGNTLLLAEWLQQKVTAGKSTEAFDRLDRLRRNKPLAGDLMNTFIDLALSKGNPEVAIEAADAFGFDRLNDSLRVILTERTLADGKAAIASRIASAGRGGFLNAHPLLAARLAFARGDWAEAARYLKNAESGGSLTGSERLAIATLDVSLGRQMEATEQLGRIDLASGPDELPLETARLYIAIGKASEGVQRLDRIRAARPGFAVEQAWALVAAAGERGNEVARWMQGKTLPEPLLRDLSTLAQDHGEKQLALAAAERLFGQHSDAGNRLLLARALDAAGRPVEALPHLRVLVSGNEPEVEEIYTAALLGAIRSTSGGGSAALKKELGAFWSTKLDQTGQNEEKQLEIVNGLLDLEDWSPALAKLEVLARRREGLAPLFVETAVKAGKRTKAVDFLKADLARADLPLKTREERLYALLDLAGQAEALPYIRELAAAGFPAWIVAYEEALRKLSRRNELLDFWRDRLSGEGISAEERRGIGYKLVDEGKPEWARSVFAGLSRTAPPDSPDVAEWLFLWGSSPGREATEWMEGRARSSRGAERIGWLNRLLEAGAAKLVISVVSADPPISGSGGALFEIYLRALAAQNEILALAAAIARESGATSDPERVRHLAVLAREQGGVAAAVPAYNRLAELTPGDPDALHWLAVFARSRGRYSEAERLLRSLLASSEGQFDDNFNLAEILWRQGKRSEARAYYGRALRLIERLPSPSVEARAAHAQALSRSGYMQRALQEYRTIIDAEPSNGDLRADFAAMLLEGAKYDEADQVLAGSVASGATRVALLRAQLLSSTGRMPEAMDLMQSLANRNSESAGVTAALGQMEQNVGRDRLARSLIGRAADMDAGNEDLIGALAEIEKARAGQIGSQIEYRSIHGAQNEEIVHLTGQSLISSAVRALFSAEQDTYSIRAVQRTNGSDGPANGVARRAEAAIEWESENGLRIKGSLLSGGSSVGVAASVVRPDLHGATSAAVEVGRPYWDFSQSLAQDGTRDRVEIRRDWKVGDRTSIQLGTAANRYDLPGKPRAAESVAEMASVSVRVLRAPQISLNYALDAEYRLDGGTFTPLPLVSREVHAGSVQADKQLARGLHATGSAGFAVDRLGGHAPFGGGGLIYDRFRHFGARVDYDRRLYQNGSSQTVTSVRAGVFWLF